MPVFEIEANGKTYEVDAPDMMTAAHAFRKSEGTTSMSQSAAPTQPDVGRASAFGSGVYSGLTANFGDELSGVAAAAGRPKELQNPLSGPSDFITGAAKLGYESLFGGDDASKRYATRRDEVRANQKAAQEQYPWTNIAGNITGAIALPVGGALNAATLPARMGRGAAVGAAYGGLSGVGEGQTLEDRAAKGTTGALLGGAIGGIAPPVVEGVLQGGRQLLNPFVTATRGAVNPENEAARRVATALQRDERADPNAVNRLTQQEYAATPEARVMDLGGETTRGLARSAANTSPEGRAALGNVINDRYEGQATRVSDWLRQSFNYPNAHAQQEALETASRTANRGAYARAYQEGDRGLWSPELERLTSSPDVVAAMRTAATSGKSRAVRDGMGGFNPGVTIENDIVRFNRGQNGVPTYPNLQFWDYTKRALDDATNAARRAGRNEEAGVLSGLTSQLRGELDRLVPSFGQARAGAARFFGAENALEAGQNYVMQNFATRETRAALARMTPQERQLFQDGFVSRLVETIDRAGDRRNILNQIGSSPAAREKLTVALGPQRATELEAGLRIEGIMDMARGAVQGNSTTARQLTELGFAGGAAGLGGVGAYNMDPQQMTIAAVAGALLAGRRAIDQNVARRVAEMLASNDQQTIQRGIQLVARNSRMMDALRASDARIAQIGGQESPKGALIQAPSASRAEDQ